tara:strand:- start:48 stop:494 length:447 start_codon:yes stop_codon:yes gene_type:complete
MIRKIMIRKISDLRMNFNMKRIYHKKVIDHYEFPRNVGSFSKDEKNIGIGLVGKPACGDLIKLSIRVDKDSVIQESKFKAFGCGSAIASSSIITELIQGKNIDDALKINNTDIAKLLDLPPIKMHCSMLAEDAVKAAIENYKKNNYTD